MDEDFNNYKNELSLKEDFVGEENLKKLMDSVEELEKETENLDSNNNHLEQCIQKMELILKNESEVLLNK